MSKTPHVRIRTLGDQPVRPTGDYVLYWMIANRRTTWNFSFQRAADLAHELGKPLVVFEALRVGYPWASDRLHQFIIQGMADNRAALADQPVLYYPYLEPQAGDGRGLLAALAQASCAVISDDFPCFFLPRMIESARRQIPVRLELVDSNGLFPMYATDRVFHRAFDLRRFFQKQLLPHLEAVPRKNPLARRPLPTLESLPAELHKRWPAADVERLAEHPEALSDLPIDHDVHVSFLRGGAQAAERRLVRFLREGLPKYHEARNEPTQEVSSGLSPYLHFGHISAHDIFNRVITRESWHPGMVAEKGKGSAQGWWGLPECVESFLDELITWRELGYNMCSHQTNYDQYESLPDWAQRTLREHERDPRDYVYSLEQFATAGTHDELWNAAQRQLVREGRMHNYLRMLWGKKILEWTASPRDALDIMIELNNKYALDGRNPNSYSGIFWVLGRYDRAWGPERRIFGKIRYMSSENTARKVKVKPYLEQYAADDGQRQLFS